MIGTTIGDKYAIVREIGAGGMGAVYEARHTGTGRRVAVKVITSELALNEQLRARFELEARAAGAIESEHVAQVLDVGHDAARGAPYLVMELLVGEELARVLERLGPLPPDVVLRIGVQACLGLAKAHAQGIVHRDIKPANIFLSQRDSGELTVKLLDFGIAKVLEADAHLGHGPGAPDGGALPPPGQAGRGALTRVGAFLGSTRYMAPEQTFGSASVDARTDLWSLGIVLYEALTGGTPFDAATSVPEFVALVNTRPVTPIRERAPWVDPALAQAVERALAIIPAERYQSAAEMRAAFEAFLPAGAAIRAGMLVTGRAGATYTTVTTSSGGAVSVGAPMAPQAMWQATVPGVPVPGVPAASMASAPGIAGPTMVTPGPAPSRGGSTGKTLAIAAGALGLVGLGSLVAVLATGALRRAETDADDAPSAAPSASAPREVTTATPELLSIVGPWWGEGGLSYEAVQSGEGVEMRFRDAEPLATQGYVSGDTHFTLRALSAERLAFRVVARIRPPPPKGTTYDKKSRATCENTWRNVAGKPLRAVLEGERLRVTLVRAEPPAAAFQREGTRVVKCTDLAKAPVTEVEVVLTRSVTTAPPPKPTDPGPKRDAGAPPPDAGTPVDAGSPWPPPVDAGSPWPPPVDAGHWTPTPGSRPNGVPCSRDGDCISAFCAARRCADNDLGRRCAGPAQCASRKCIGGRCGR